MGHFGIESANDLIGGFEWRRPSGELAVGDRQVRRPRMGKFAMLAGYVPGTCVMLLLIDRYSSIEAMRREHRAPPVEFVPSPLEGVCTRCSRQQPGDVSAA